MKRTIAMVLALMMAFALVPVIGMSTAEAEGTTGIKFTTQPARYYLLNDKLDLSAAVITFYQYDANGMILDEAGTVVTDSVTYHLSDKNRAVTDKAALATLGEHTLTASYKSGDKTYTATTKIRVRTEKVNAVSLLRGLTTSTYFVGETLDLAGLSYGLSYKSYIATESRTEAQDLSKFTLRETDENGTLLTLGSLPKLTTPTAGTPAVVWAGIEIEDQWNKTYASTAAKYSVLATPASVKLSGMPTTALSESDIGKTTGTVQLTATTVIGSDSATEPSYVTWGSSDEKVATVSSTGKLTVVGVGKTTITVRTRGDGQKTDSAELVVAKAAIPLTDVSLDKTQKTLVVGESDKLTATLVPVDGDYEKIEWTSDAAAIAKVTGSEDGKTATIEGLKAGTATITVKVTGPKPASGDAPTFEAKCIVTVNDIPVSQVYVTPTAVTLLDGQAYQIEGTVLPYDATDPKLTWTSSDNALAAVKDGRVTVQIADWTKIDNPATGAKWTAADVNAGKCYTTVKITCASASNPKAPVASCTVTIKQGTLATQLSLNKYSASLAIGGSTQLAATVLPTNATTKTVTWRSSDPTIATVSNSGKVTALKAGKCTITATSNGSGTSDITESCTVTVSAVMSGSIGLNALNLTLYHNQSATLVATLYPSNTTNKDVTFTSSKPGVASVDPSSGLITALGNGKTTITVTANDGSGATASCLVSVMDQVAVTKLTLSMSDFSLMLNDTTTLSAAAYPDYASETEVTWSSSNPNAVSVDENGKVSGLAAGQSAVITATAKDGSGVTASVGVDVVTTFYGNGKVVNCLRRVNVREKASGQAKFMGYAYLNATYKVLGKTGNWYKINYEGKSCYIWAAYIRLIGDGSAEYTSAGKATAPATGGTTTTPDGTTSTTPTKCTITNCVYAVNVRSGPGTTYDKIGIAPLNTNYKYLGTYGDWYKLQFNNTTEGYIHSNYIFLG